MDAVVFRMEDGTSEDETARLREELLAEGIRVDTEIRERGQGQLLVTDRREELADAKSRGVAAVFYERQDAPHAETDCAWIVQGLEEVDVRFLTRVYERYHGIPWVIAQTERLRIRESTGADLEPFREMYREENTAKFAAEPHLWEEEGREFLTYLQTMYRFYGYGIWTVTEKETGAVVGRAGLGNASVFGTDVLEIGYLTGETWRNRGYAKEASAAVCRFAREELGATELYARIHPDNRASAALAQGLGFVRIGTEPSDGFSVWRKTFAMRRRGGRACRRQ